MSVLIKDMEMPKDGVYWCEISVADDIAMITIHGEDRKSFPLVPVADVVEMRHGRWIKDGETGKPICSVCKSGKPTRAVVSSVIERKLNNYEIRYCYYCGARMEEQE